MDLPHKFKEQAAQGGTDYNAPPYKIRGSDLDDNFNKVKPRTTLGEGEELPYRLDENTKEGWRLIFPWWPPPSGGESVLISISGKMQWLPTAPTQGNFVLGAEDGAIKWIATEDCNE
jgi:hypothetical protein